VGNPYHFQGEEPEASKSGDSSEQVTAVGVNVQDAAFEGRVDALHGLAPPALEVVHRGHVKGSTLSETILPGIHSAMLLHVPPATKSTWSKKCSLHVDVEVIGKIHRPPDLLGYQSSRDMPATRRTFRRQN